MASNSNCIIEARRICRRANNVTWLLRDVSLCLNHNDHLAIVGPSGSGKTLLLRALANLDPFLSGQLLWKGQRVEGNRVPEYRSRVMYLQQSPTMIEGTVEFNLRLPYDWLYLRCQHFEIERAVRLMEQFGRDRSFLKKKTSDLSGGELTIVAMIRALQFDPAVLLLDEPTAALDDDTACLAEEVILNWSKGPGFRAFAWVSHHSEQIARLSNRVIKIEQGRIDDDSTFVSNSDPATVG